MPTKTYDNLSNDKKERIFAAGVLEFSYHSFNDASVNTIVKMANISKGSFYQYFEDKSDFYWFIVMEVFIGTVGNYFTILKDYKGDLFKTEEQLFNHLLNLFEDAKYKNLIQNVYQYSFMEFSKRMSARASIIYINMYDLLMKFGFKGYNIKTKDDFLIVFDMMRSITNSTILAMVRDNLSIKEAKERYIKQLLVLEKGILKRGFF